MLSYIALSVLVPLLLSSCLASPLQTPRETTLEKRQSSSMITFVDLATNTGNSVHRASGLLYGVPDPGSQIPSSFYTGMGFNHLSAGGAQFPDASGWIGGGYTGRFQDVLANYKTAKSFGAQFMLKTSDLWGADATQPSNAIWPGDGGSYAEYDRFLTQLVSDLKANGMTDIMFLIWNEPDLSIFWAVGIDRYLQTWTHTANFLKSNLPGVRIAGPSFSSPPNSGNTWWQRWLTECKNSGTAPNVYTWHHEFSTNDNLNDLSVAQPNMVNLINSFGLPMGEFIIDEYGILAEQVPGGAAWWIGSFERWNMYGLRGNWVSTWKLQDFFAGLLGKTNNNDRFGTGYYSNGEYQVYKYYVNTMIGHRVKTTRSTDKKMDSYAVVDTHRVRILVGGRQVTGTYQLTIQNLSVLGLPTSGTITVHTFEFPYTGVTGRVDAPTDLGTVAHTYSGNTLSFPIFQTSTTTTWAFEFDY
ncbi:hypothetical protein E1B28_010227 [Marasmius oreades]|uniref:Glycosyl hydrolases family 39 N-terminal catalytic domain-containing protein n=1 Tax=Marasmius oreades TaxID=181124 RepID=A0A9P7URK1_9AGAR|nr:uncharacterized protein E1B28_010227 [Marasmius oreades]KAG7091175.1 hypothetical protein E1B28_010227 [Marasmius oreades]